MSELGEIGNDPFTLWRDVERIPSGRIVPATREILLEYIEEPLKESVGILYDKNILTLGSSCNAHNYMEGFAWITLDWATLASKNQKVAKLYPHSERTTILGMDVEIVGLHFPIKEDRPEDIGRHATALAKQFRRQPMLWVPRYSVDEFRQNFKSEEVDFDSCSETQLIEAAMEGGYYFDPETYLFYLSKEHFDKVTQAQ